MQAASFSTNDLESELPLPPSPPPQGPAQVDGKGMPARPSRFMGTRLAQAFFGGSKDPPHPQAENVEATESEEPASPSRLDGPAEVALENDGMQHKTQPLERHGDAVGQAQPEPESEPPAPEPAPEREIPSEKIAAAHVAATAKVMSGPPLKFHQGCLMESVGFQLANDYFLVMVHAGCELSTFGGMTLSTGADDQTEFELPLYAGTNSSASRNRYLGICLITGVSPAPRGQGRIEVRFTACEDGTLDISAHMRDSGLQLGVELRDLPDALRPR